MSDLAWIALWAKIQVIGSLVCFGLLAVCVLFTVILFIKAGKVGRGDRG